MNTLDIAQLVYIHNYLSKNYPDLLDLIYDDMFFLNYSSEDELKDIIDKYIKS